jgi:hypothetical protein
MEKNMKNIINDESLLISIRPYISIDILPKSYTYTGDSLYSRLKNEQKHNIFEVNENEQLRRFCFTNMGNGNAYRFQLTNVYRYVQVGANWHRITNNIVILPVCTVLPILRNNDNDKQKPQNNDQEFYLHEKAVLFRIDLGEKLNEKIEAEFYDIADNKYTQTFIRIASEDDSTDDFVKKYIRYRAEPPKLVPRDEKKNTKTVSAF